MDDEHESEEPTGTTVEGSAPAEAVTPGPPAFIAVPGSTYTGAGGWSWTPPPPPPPPAPPFPGVTGSSYTGAGGWTWTPPPPPPPPPPPGPPGTVGAGTQWVGTPGPNWAVLPTPQLKRLQAPTALLVVALLVIGVAAGFGIGRVAWQSRSTSTSQPSASSPSSGFPFGSGTLPFGSGTFPFGSGSSGSISTAPGGPADPSAIAQRVDPGLVDVNTTLSYYSEEAAGTGIVLTSSGEVLTNNHVIDGATSIKVTDLGNGRVYTAAVAGYDRSSDIAVLKLNGASGLRVAPLGDSSTVRPGEAIVGIGNAGGAGGTPSVAGGSVTALNRSITATEQDGGNPENLKGLIEVNADIQAGDSGGPLVNTSGKVVGMDTAASVGFSFQTTGTQGFAIPVNSAVAIAKKIESGQASASVHIGPTAFLGVQVSSSQSGSSPSGAVIDTALSSAPAASAGLAAGDVITSLGGHAVGSAPALTTLMQLYHPGDRVKVDWTDSTGSRHSATVQLAAGPAA